MSTLDKFGVPIPGGTRAPMKQPKPKYRFRILFFGFGATGDGSYVSMETNTAGTPKIEHENVSVHSYNSVAHYKGKHTISTVDVVVRDTIDSTSMKAIWNQCRKEFNYYSQESRTSASQFKFEMWIQALDGSNSETSDNLYEGTLHTWICQGCFIVSNDFGEWDYSSSEAQTLSLTIQPDAAYLMGADGTPMGDSVSGNGTPSTSGAITTGQTSISADTLADSNFYEGDN